MAVLRQYLFSVLSAALICGIICDVAEHTFFKKHLRLICSVFFAATLLGPISKNIFPEFRTHWQDYLLEAQAAAERGQEIADQSIAQLIKEQTEAYILTEAERIGMDILPQVSLRTQTPPVPDAVVIQGIFDAAQMAQLEQLLSQKLGIPKENQTWIRQEYRTLDIS